MRLNDRPISPEGHATELFTRWGIEYVRGQAAEKDPFFLYLAYNAPHSPLQPPAEWLERVQERQPETPAKRQRLIALIEHMDHNIGLFIRELEESGQRENTLVIFTSDNGGDGGSIANNGPTRGNKGDMFEGGIKVPCAFNQPGVFDGGRRVDDLIMLMDIFPTLCEKLDIKVGKTDGISVLGAIDGKAQNTFERYLYWLRYEGGEGFDNGKTPQTAVRYGNRILMRNRPVQEQQMFDLSSDPLQQNPLTPHSDGYEDLERAMRRHFIKSQTVRRK
jgi:arylsulfatase A-like enzyme